MASIFSWDDPHLHFYNWAIFFREPLTKTFSPHCSFLRRFFAAFFAFSVNMVGLQRWMRPFVRSFGESWVGDIIFKNLTLYRSLWSSWPSRHPTTRCSGWWLCLPPWLWPPSSSTRLSSTSLAALWYVLARLEKDKCQTWTLPRKKLKQRNRSASNRSIVYDWECDSIWAWTQ